jgi:hypothetical protein
MLVARRDEGGGGVSRKYTAVRIKLPHLWDPVQEKRRMCLYVPAVYN